MTCPAGIDVPEQGTSLCSSTSWAIGDAGIVDNACDIQAGASGKVLLGRQNFKFALLLREQGFSVFQTDNALPAQRRMRGNLCILRVRVF